MIELRQDPSNPEKIILTATVTLFLDRLLLSALGEELEAAIREQAKRDLASRALSKELKSLATKKLTSMLEERR